MRVEIYSDVVCPWCYIGKRRLEKAMAMTADRFAFDVEYFPFELNPQMPDEGSNYREYLCRKFGSEAKFHELNEHVKRVAAHEGLDFRMEPDAICFWIYPPMASKRACGGVPMFSASFTSIRNFIVESSLWVWCDQSCITSNDVV